MSKRFVIKLAGAAALGGAALLLGTPTAAMAYDGEDSSDSNVCGNIVQSNEALAASVFEKNFIEDSEVAVDVDQTIEQENEVEESIPISVCINDVKVDLELGRSLPVPR
ncbi:hypothetical protein AB0873_14020 [Micromonospora sp. NPDC047707]|uniref:hypothetical protein n=1 Tax=Micromonospora sp. NPDC047707 TaxID=3154498 RepID=UPI003452B272